MSVSDIDDRTIGECLKQGRSIQEFAAEHETAVFEDLKTLRVRPAHVYCRASEHVSDMTELTRSLLEQGLAYEKLRSVYFSIKGFREYGRLSRVDLAEVQVPKSTEYDYYEKDNPRDFALFKRSTLVELKAGIYWSTPWGSARPSWHVECASMATTHLGQPFDIHTAGADLIFPHGDNEIAICEGLAGQRYANHWMHSEVVMMDGRKVGRRAGNELTLRQVMENGFTGADVRFWLLSSHYRTVLKYSAEDLARARRSRARLNEFVARLRDCSPGQHSPDLDQMLYEAKSRFHETMDSDLNVPQALGHLFAFVRRTNRLLDSGLLDSTQVDAVLDFVQSINGVLDVFDLESGETDPKIRGRIRSRNEARAAGDFETADRIREELKQAGIELADSPSGTRWRRYGPAAQQDKHVPEDDT